MLDEAMEVLAKNTLTKGERSTLLTIVETLKEQFSEGQSKEIEQDIPQPDIPDPIIPDQPVTPSSKD